MLRGAVLHPGLLAGLAGLGHGAQVLVADANYPSSTAAPRHAPRVHLNVVPGVVDGVTVVRAVCSLLPVEQMTLMAPHREGLYAMAGDPDIWVPYDEAVRSANGPVETRHVGRLSFYDEARGDDVGLVVVTAETRLYANALLRVGVVAPGGGA